MIEHGDVVLVNGYIGDVIEVKDNKAFIHFGGDSLHCCQEWHDLSEVLLFSKNISVKGAL